MQSRAVRHPEDLDALDRMFELCRVADGHAPIGEHKYLDLLAGSLETVARVFESDDGIVAYVHLNRSREGEGWVLEAAIHPGYRHPDTLEEIVRSAVDLAALKGAGPVRIWVHHPSVAKAVSDLGFRRERQLLQMRLPLPPEALPEVPPGFRLAGFRVGTDEAAWLTVNNRAFAGHPENGAWSRETLRDRFEQEWFDPAGLLMAWRGPELAGFCWTKLHPGALGEIYVIAVDPQYQRRSLGTWLTLEGLWHLYREREAATGMLYVDAANGAAVRMYERIGLGVDHIDRSFVWSGEAQEGTGDPNTRAHDGQARSVSRVGEWHQGQGRSPSSR